MIFSRRGLKTCLVSCGVALAVLVAGIPLDAFCRETLGHPGYLILVAAADTSGSYKWQEGPAFGQLSLVWPDGVLTIPDTLAMESFGDRDLAVPCGAALSGSGASGVLMLEDGRFDITEPLVLGDGTVQLFVSAGEFDVQGQRIRYTSPSVRGPDSRAGYVFLTGMVILVVTLLRRARVKSRERI